MIIKLLLKFVGRCHQGLQREKTYGQGEVLGDFSQGGFYVQKINRHGDSSSVLHNDHGRHRSGPSQACRRRSVGQESGGFYKAEGKEKALAEFNNPKGQFVKDDLYIYVLDLNGKMLAHPKAELVGKDFMTVKDADGKLFAVDMVKMAKEKGSGWVDYKWENPKTKKIDPKTAYFEKVDDVIIAAGAYKG